MDKQHYDKVIKILTEFDPTVAPLAEVRFYSGKQLYNASTHKFRAPHMDASQARAILIAVKRLGEMLGTPVWFSKDELRLLNAYHVDDTPRPKG